MQILLVSPAYILALRGKFLGRIDFARAGGVGLALKCSSTNLAEFACERIMALCAHQRADPPSTFVARPRPGAPLCSSSEKKFDIFVLRTSTGLNPLEAMLCYSGTVAQKHYVDRRNAGGRFGDALLRYGAEGKGTRGRGRHERVGDDSEAQLTPLTAHPAKRGPPG